MPKIDVCTNENPTTVLKVDLSSVEWSSLQLQNMTPFNLDETKRPCEAYPDGLFPGAVEVGANTQRTVIHCYHNVVEFSKIVSDEVELVDGKLYLTTKYYDRRKVGWTSKTPKKKWGTVIGFCLNGDIYSPVTQEDLENIFYLKVIIPLIKEKYAYKILKDKLDSGTKLIITGDDKRYLKVLSHALISNSK